MSRPPGRMTTREAAVILLAAVALSAYFNWPLSRNPAGYGRTEIGDAMFSLWNVAWVAHALVTPGADVYDANIFHPHERTLAFSEPNLGAGTVAVPAYLLTGNAYAAHNSVVLIAFALCVVGMYLLARRLTGSREGALVAAIVFAFCPFIFARTAHIQLMMTAPIPFTLLAFHRFADRVTAGRAVVLGVALGVQALFCSYYGVLAGLLVGLGVLVFAVVQGYWRQPRWWGLSALAALVSVLTVLPFFIPYAELQQETGFGRALDESRQYSATWRAYLTSSATAHRWMLPYVQPIREVLFPGYTAVVLGLVGMAVALRHLAGGAHAEARMARANAIFYLFVFGLALWISFGPAAGLYTALYHAIPVFSLLRAPARFGIAVTLALAVFTAVASAVLLERVRPRWRTAVTGALVILAIAELSTPMPYGPAREMPRAYKVLAAAEPGPVAEFPFYDTRPHNAFRHTLYMLGSTTHWQPLINGYSDFIPPDFAAGAPLLDEFPNAEGFAWLRERQARYLIFHLGLYGAEDERALRERLEAHAQYLRPRWVHGSVLLYEIVGWPGAAP